MVRIPARRSQKVACVDCNLIRICIPSGMESDAVENLGDVVRRNRNLRKGEAIYHAGERFTSIYALKSGTAKLVHTDRFGRESIIAVLLPGELLGFDGLSSGKYLC
jgi:CRP/FNR family transcriptional regulator, anaerobic regulatory protein